MPIDDLQFLDACPIQSIFKNKLPLLFICCIFQVVLKDKRLQFHIL